MLEKAKKYSIGLWALRGTADRFVPEGYGKGLSVTGALEAAGSIEGINAVDFVSDVFEHMEPRYIKRNLRKNGLEPAGINLHSWKGKWSLGSLTNLKKGERQKALNYGKEILDKAKEIGCNEVTLWLGTEGFDYFFQIEYERHWNLLIKGVRKLAEYREDMNIGLEYKLKEPRKHQTIGTALKALYVANEVDLDNIGVVVDFGHALMAKEDAAESIYLTSRENRLTGVHFNDAYREWDDDLVSGTVNLWDSIEFLYYLDKVSFEGWISFDIFPFRIPSTDAVATCVKTTDKMIELLERINFNKLKRAQEEMDISTIQRELFGIL